MVRICRANPKESEKIRAIEKQAHRQDVTSRYDAALITRFGYAYAAKEKGKVIGAITAWQTKDGKVKINDWAVHPSHQKSGVGEKLYRKLIQETRGKEILSLVNTKNTASVRAHQNFGFKIVKKIIDPFHENKKSICFLFKLKNKV